MVCSRQGKHVANTALLDKHIFLLSEHIYVYELLKWQGKLNGKALQILLNCS